MLQVRIILEVLGRPAENVQHALASVVTKIAGEKDVKITESIFHEPVPVPDAHDLFTAFAEVTLEIASLERYFDIIFSYVPSHAELLNPERITLDSARFNHFANQVLNRMHNYDAVVKNVIVERDILLKKIQQEAPQLIQELAQQAQQSKQGAKALVAKKSGKKEKKKQTKKAESKRKT